jgi:peptidoglycan hydrolase-like protein with peptidoglycan-binding domain
MAKRKKKSAMTASILTQLPLMAGSALLGTVSRAGLWTFSRYMRAPLASTGLLAMVTLTALAGSNALYFQTAVHPSPFFSPPRDSVAALPTPTVERPAAIEQVAAPVAQPVALPSVPAAAPVAGSETTGSVPVAVPDTPVGNARMFEVQKKLSELRLFTGKVDGYYGPQTASAIRAFEQQNGMELTGSTEARVLEAILSSDSSGRVATPVAPAPQAQLAPQQPVQPVVQQAALVVQPAAPVAQPVVAPAPQDQVVGRVPGLSRAEEAFDSVAQSAASTIDSIIAAVDTPRSTPQTVANPPIPVASVPVAQVQPMPAPLQPAAEVSAAPVAQLAVAPSQQQALRPAEDVPYVAPATDGQLVAQIQRGLASLGFFRAPVDGKPGAETSRAIREFENFHSYKMTGQVKPDLVELLRKAGATI